MPNHKLFFPYLILIGVASVVLFIVMGADKGLAKAGKRRVPEATLFLLALIGGALGGSLGMLAFRHKTKHVKFIIGFPLILIAQLALAALLLF